MLWGLSPLFQLPSLFLIITPATSTTLSNICSHGRADLYAYIRKEKKMKKMTNYMLTRVMQDNKVIFLYINISIYVVI